MWLCTFFFHLNWEGRWKNRTISTVCRRMRAWTYVHNNLYTIRASVCMRVRNVRYDSLPSICGSEREWCLHQHLKRRKDCIVTTKRIGASRNFFLWNFLSSFAALQAWENGKRSQKQKGRYFFEFCHCSTRRCCFIMNQCRVANFERKIPLCSSFQSFDLTYSEKLRRCSKNEKFSRPTTALLFQLKESAHFYVG